MREAFASQSVEALMQVADKMDQEVFQHHLERCIASGLWVRLRTLLLFPNIPLSFQVPNAKENEGEEEAASTAAAEEKS